MKKTAGIFLILIAALALGGCVFDKGGDALPLNTEKPASGEETPDDKTTGTSTSGLIRKCPSAWYQDNMPIISIPGDGGVRPRDTIIIDGKSYSSDQVDIDWVQKNCDVENPELVY
jgi:hypothetical protein